MDSKIPMPSHDREEAAPPSYSESILSPSAAISTYYRTQIQSQLATLSTEISSLSTQKTLLSHANDEKILSLLTTQIQIYLSRFAQSGLRRGTLILVPAQGLEDDHAQPCDYDFKDPEEFDDVARVRGKEDGEGETWYWRNEEMARRLVDYLRPTRDLRNQELPPRPRDDAVESSSRSVSAAGSRFWRKKSVVTNVATAAKGEAGDTKRDSDLKSPKSPVVDKVAMDVSAEEVVFRTENDMGIFGTETGWAVVVKLRLTLEGPRI
ncbi:hypothetical protein B7494_g7747 [Chlorociboria aeruginascens]|nr:hypothetical protein B7494_g7747 [Chlorociboria aeruginascens]